MTGEIKPCSIVFIGDQLGARKFIAKETKSRKPKTKTKPQPYDAKAIAFIEGLSGKKP